MPGLRGTSGGRVGPGFRGFTGGKGDVGWRGISEGMDEPGSRVGPFGISGEGGPGRSGGGDGRGTLRCNVIMSP